MPTVRIASPLRRLTGGRVAVEVEGGDLGSVIADLDARHPGMRERLVDADGGLRRHVNVFVGDVQVRPPDELAIRVDADAIISLVPAVAGGA